MRTFSARLTASVFAFVVLTGAAIAAQRATGPQAAAWKIVVIAGEDAVNIIQQKTAVAPLIEVRDRNDQPVAGALVTFTLKGSRVATFARNAQTLSVTTDAAGRALAASLSPTATGTIQIDIQAAFQGQIATATITQTNVLTAAQAAAIGNAGGRTVAGGASAAGAAAGAASVAGAGGGGLSGLAIGAIAGGVGAGALIAAKAAGGESGGSNSTGSAPPPPTASTPPPTVSTPPPTAPTPPPPQSPFEIEWTFDFGTNLFAITQCPLYNGPPGTMGSGPFAFGGRANADGTFSWVFSILTPAGQAVGRFTQTDVTATIGCLGGGGPAGSLAGTGTLQEYRGTWNWGNQSGAFVARPLR
jgi:hypothetical protein